jgi:hypothetical protein
MHPLATANPNTESEPYRRISRPWSIILTVNK